MNFEQTIDFAVAAIRQFLAERPDGADTLEGIHRWWIRWPYEEESSLCTLAGLERLQALGEIEQVRLGNSILWRRKR